MHEGQDTQQDTEQAKSFWGKAVQRFSVAWLCSMFFHVALLVGLAVVTLTQLNKDEAISLAASEVSHKVEETIEIPLDFQEDEVEEPVENLQELTEDAWEDSLKASDVVAEFSDEIVSEDFGELSADFGIGEAVGTGTNGEGLKKSSKSKFFQGGEKAKTIVYVVDNSNSMTGRNISRPGFGRMETALIELAKSVNSLDETQQFYVVFYSDTAYGLFHPRTVSNYVYATPQNKQLVNAWLDTVCLLYTSPSPRDATLSRMPSSA